jgi:hypothetical protein
MQKLDHLNSCVGNYIAVYRNLSTLNICINQLNLK